MSNHYYIGKQAINNIGCTALAERLVKIANNYKTKRFKDSFLLLEYRYEGKRIDYLVIQQELIG